MKTQQPPMTTEPRELDAIELDRQVCQVRFSTCGKFLAAAGYDGQIHRWFWNNGQPEMLPKLGGHHGWVTVMAYAADAPRLFSADSWGGLIAWSTEDANAKEVPLKPCWQHAEAHDGWVRSLGISPDGTQLLTAGRDGMARLWSAENGNLLKEFSCEQDVFAVAIHPDGKSAVTGDLYGKVVQWNLSTGRREREINASKFHYYQRDQDVAGIRVLQFVDEGKTLVVAGGEPTSTGRGLGIPTVRFFDWVTGKSTDAIHQGESNDGFVFDVVRHPSGVYMTVTSGQPGRGQFVLHRRGEEKPFFIGKKLSNGHSLALHPGGRHLVIAATNRNSQGNGAVKDKEGKYLGNYSPLHLFEIPDLV